MSNSLKDLLAGLQCDYISSLPKKCELLKAHWQSGNLHGLQTEFHKLKGTGCTYGVPELSHLGEAMEAICLRDRTKLSQVFEASLTLLDRIQRARENGHTYALDDDADFKLMLTVVAAASSSKAG